MKRKWALCPVNIWDVETMERWLEDEAARGWRLDGSRQWSGWRVRFLRTEPAACRVRMQPVGFISQEAWRERIETCREMGWDCGASFRWQIDMAAFYCDDPDAPELDTDMEVWAMVWRKAFAWGLWESIGLGILGLALLASVLLLGWEIAVTEPLLLLAIQTLGGAGLTLWAALSVPKLLRLRRQASVGLREPPRGTGGGPPGGAGVRCGAGPGCAADSAGKYVRPDGTGEGKRRGTACAGCRGVDQWGF